MIDERTRLASEINELTSIIAETPDRRLFMKKSLQSRLKSVQERYDALLCSESASTAQPSGSVADSACVTGAGGEKSTL